MTTVGWVLVLMGVVTAMSAARGRGINDLVGDLGDLTTAAITGDYDAVNEVLARRGDGITADQTNFTDGGTIGGAIGDAVSGAVGGGATASAGSTPAGLTLLAEVVKLGTGKRYVLGTSGPNTYDCSGLTWAAMRNTGLYSGPRYTTATWGSVAAAMNATEVTSPAVGDIVWWPGHMGVVDNPAKGTYFSARSPKYGISSSGIDITSDSRGAKPRFWRLP